MSRLVLASNRVGDVSGATQAGGLATAVGDALRDLNGVWFGWSGDVVAEDLQVGLRLDRQDNVTIATQALTAREYDTYYIGYSNRALWPVGTVTARPVASAELWDSCSRSLLIRDRLPMPGLGPPAAKLGLTKPACCCSSGTRSSSDIRSLHSVFSTPSV